jgi:crotonobetainyl-CoA:carnitine CoA-transferase CaiB-like acyl-CoA transferase
MPVQPSEDGPRPLAGIRVLDLSRMVSGPLCGRLLADLGADVVKVQPPEGDRTNTVPPLISGVSPYYAQLNVGKRIVVVDLKADGGPAVVQRLARGSDVLLENFRPGVLGRYGLDAQTLTAADPRLIYCSVTGWGQTGPWRDERAFAPLIHAATGMLEMAARVRSRAPETEVHQHGDVYPALLACSAILGALFQRERTGRGQQLDVAMGQAAVYVDEWAAVNLHPPQSSFASFDTWNHDVYELGDTSFVALVGDPADTFPVWAPALGAPESLTTDPRFATRDSRQAHRVELIAALNTLTRAFPDFDALAKVLGPWMLAAPVRSVAELAKTDWAAERGLFVEALPGVPVPAAPWKSNTASIGARPIPPQQGAGPLAVLTQLGGFSADEASALVQSGVVA